MIIMDKELEISLERIKTLCKQKPSHKEVLGFLKKVITAQAKIKSDIKIEDVPFDKEMVQMKFKEGFPLLNKEALNLDVVLAKSLFKKMSQIVSKKVPEDIEQINQVFKKKKLDVESLLKGSLRENGDYINTVAQRLRVKPAVLSFLVKNTLKPFFEVYAEKVRDFVDQEHWLRSYCPVCGSKPFMAELQGKERKKFLVCSVCGYKWRFVRLKCPFCGTYIPRGFRYFYTENEGKTWRVEVCDKCKRYIKTVDTVETGEQPIPEIDDIGTLYLDILAENEGYKREIGSGLF
jgi:FdhE protein